ncbi:MAG: transglycosylase SLT domain-containing protein [Pseudoxanthomonas sp.]
MPVPIRLSACLLLLAALAPAARAQAPAALDAQREAVRQALAAAESGQLVALQDPALAGSPLLGWIEYAQLKRNIGSVERAQAEDFLRRQAGQPVAEAFLDAWLPELARRQDWPGFLAAWQPRQGAALRCARLQALAASGRTDPTWTAEAQDLWRTAGQPLADGCDPVFAILDAAGGLTPDLRWERFDAAADAAQPAVMRVAARGLPAADAALANLYAAWMQTPDARAAGWPKTARSRAVATAGLAALARKAPASAEALLPSIAAGLGLDPAQRGQVLYQVALWTVASYGPESARRLAAVPEAAWDERLHEWQVREALARSDWPSALAAIRRMGGEQRADPRWRYFEARLLDKTGQPGAPALYAQAAASPTFHGFLAADRLGQGYVLCPLQAGDSDAAKAAIARDPGMVRAMELWKLQRPAWATAEWNAALKRLDDGQRRVAVEVAQDNGWFDRAVFSFGKTPDELRYYALRFPLQHAGTVRAQAAANGLDPAWVAAEIRAESIFDPHARSPANARGLMQLLPGTGADTARKLGLAWGGADSLYDADTNITLGSAYLRQMLDTWGQPYLAIAAYNAGSGPVGRWLAQRPAMDPDFWIETIGYKETRDYVARVLAFSVLYDWRLRGDALALSQRMTGRFDGPRKAFSCPAGG